jgi:hypothetical protein
MQRRELWETLLEIMEAAAPMEVSEWVWVTGFSLNLPVEVQAQRVHGEIKLMVDAPNWRMHTGFQEQPGRLSIECELVGNL